MTFPIVTIGEVAKVKGGKRLPQGKLVQDEPTAHPYIRVVDFRDDGLERSNIKYIDEEAFSKVHRYTISHDDVFISIAGTVGRVGIIPKDLSGANLTENAAKICDLSARLNNKFLTYFLRSHSGQAQISALTGGTSQPKLALFKIEQIQVPVPLPTTQRKIAAVLSAYDDLIENNTRRIQILEEMAQALYREWFVHFRFPGREQSNMVESEMGLVPEGWTVKPLSWFGNIVTGKTPSKEESSSLT